MLKRKLGKVAEPVSAIGFGGGAISGEGGGYGFGAISEEEAKNLLHASLDLGITLYDTAPIYGFGLSEKRLGKAFSKKRSRIFLVSKSGVTWDDEKRVDKCNDPEVTSRMLEQSLRDLATDYIDLYMIHWPDERHDIRHSMEVLAKAKEAGKIRYIGLCNSYADDINKAMEIAPVDVLQSEYNLFAREHVEAELLPLAASQNIGFMGYGTLDKGILTGRVNKDRKFDQHDARSKAPWWKKADRTWKFEAMRLIAPLLEESRDGGRGHTGLELALGFVLRKEEAGSALCGVRTVEQLETAVAAVHNLPNKALLNAAVEIAEQEARRHNQN